MILSPVLSDPGLMLLEVRQRSFASMAMSALLLFALCVTASASVAARVAVPAVVDLTADRHPVSSAIYGTNGAPDYMTEGNITGSTRMGGGDPTTVYNCHTNHTLTQHYTPTTP